MLKLGADGGPLVVESAVDLSDLFLGMFPEGFDLDVGDTPQAAVADAATSTDRIDMWSVACLTSTSINPERGNRNGGSAGGRGRCGWRVLGHLERRRRLDHTAETEINCQPK